MGIADQVRLACPTTVHLGTAGATEDLAGEAIPVPHALIPVPVTALFQNHLDVIKQFPVNDPRMIPFIQVLVQFSIVETLPVVCIHVRFLVETVPCVEQVSGNGTNGCRTPDGTCLTIPVWHAFLAQLGCDGVCSFAGLEIIKNPADNIGLCRMKSIAMFSFDVPIWCFCAFVRSILEALADAPLDVI